MAQVLDRDFQLELLSKLSEVYPQIPNMRRLFGADWEDRHTEIVRNIRYLHEHGLVEAVWSQPMSGDLQLVSAQIGARGLDFLAGDGGLSAILNVVTVKLHDDTIRDLLINRIEQASGDPTIKAKLIDRIKTLPAEALGKLTMDGLDAAMAKAPDLLSLLGDIIPKSL